MNHRWMAIVMLGLFGAGLEMSCIEAEEWSCPDDGKDHLCNVCPGACRRVLTDETSLNPKIFPRLVWMGKEEDAPTCEDYGLVSMGRSGIELREDARCPPCECSERACTEGLARYSAGYGCDGDEVKQVDVITRDLLTRFTSSRCQPMFPSSEGAPPYDAYEVEPLELTDSCYRKDGAPVPGETWKTVLVDCLQSYENVDPPWVTWGCPADEKGLRACLYDRRPVSDGFRACVHRGYGGIWGEEDKTPEDMPACPPEYPERYVSYDSVDGCGTCKCEVAHEPACAMKVSFHGDEGCTELLHEETLVSGACIGGQSVLDAQRFSVEMVRRHDEPCRPIGRTEVPLGTRVRPGAKWRVYCCEHPIGPPDDP